MHSIVTYVYVVSMALQFVLHACLLQATMYVCTLSRSPVLIVNHLHWDMISCAMMYIIVQLSRMWMSDSRQVLDEDLLTLLATTWSLPSSETLWGIPQVPSPDHLPLWCGWGPSQSDPGAVADQCMGLPTPLLPPRGGAVGVVYGWSKVRRMITTHLPVFCMYVV